MQSITKKDIDDLLKTQKIRNDVHYQELRDKILDQYGLTEEEVWIVCRVRGQRVKNLK